MHSLNGIMVLIVSALSQPRDNVMVNIKRFKSDHITVNKYSFKQVVSYCHKRNVITVGDIQSHDKAIASQLPSLKYFKISHDIIKSYFSDKYK